MSNTPDYWLIDVQIRGHWQPAGSGAYELTLEKAQNRADAVHYSLPTRVTQAVTKECWQRSPGKGWHPLDLRPEPPAARPADARAPLRADEHAVPPAIGPDGIPDEQLPYWIKS